MNLREMKENIEIQLGYVISKAEFMSAIRRIVGRINIEGEKEEIIVPLTEGESWGEYVSDQSTPVISDDDRIISLGRWANGFIWDSLNYALAMPKKYTKILSVFYDGEKMKPVPYDTLRASSTTDLYYTNVSNHLYFNKDMDSETSVLKLRARVDYDLPVSSSDEYTGMPDSAESILINGVLAALYSQPKHYNETMIALHRRQFEDDLMAYNQQVIIKQVQHMQSRTYTY